MKTKNGRTKKPVCGLCGIRKKRRTKTECCGKWICDDEGDYILFSYARNSCFRNHRRYTLCGHHFTEGHTGDWKTCQTCRNDIDTEDYVWYGTNDYNFEKLPNPPTYPPTHCAKCNRIIRRGEEEYTSIPDDTFLCEQCGEDYMREITKINENQPDGLNSFKPGIYET